MRLPTLKATAGSPRGWLLLFCTYDDCVVAGRETGSNDVFETAFEDKGSTADIVIDRFWNNPDNKDVIDAFMNNKLCVDAARGKPEAIAAYKKFAVQDYFYLVDWFKFRVLRLATMPHDDFELDDLGKELDSVHRSLDSYVKDWYITCLKPESEGGLGLRREDFQVERTVEELAYGQYLLNNSRSSSWYNLHIILTGCYWAWSKLALKLYNDPKTDRSTIFYKNWILGSIDTSTNPPQMARSAKALSLFLDKNQRIWSSQASDSQGQDLFRTVLRLEVGLFNSAYNASIKKKGILYKMPVGLPLPPGGGHSHGPHTEQGWTSQLGLESEGGNADEEGGPEDVKTIPGTEASTRTMRVLSPSASSQFKAQYVSPKWPNMHLPSLLLIVSKIYIVTLSLVLLLLLTRFILSTGAQSRTFSMSCI